MNDLLPVDAEEQFIVLTLRHLDGVASAEEETFWPTNFAPTPGFAGVSWRFAINWRRCVKCSPPKM